MGNETRVKVVKNKVAPPFREATFTIRYPQGIDRESSIFDAAIQYKILEKAGSWVKYGDKNIAQGRESAISMIRENGKFSKKLEAEIRAVAK